MLAASLILAGLALAASPPADDPPPQAPAPAPDPRFTVVTPKPTGIIGIDINDRGDVLGFEWVEEKELPGVLSQAPFLALGGKADAMTTIPLLPGYTATFPAALGDDGTVAGHAGKPPAPAGVRTVMRTQAFVWDRVRGMRGLGVLPGEWASIATGISRDGATISGFSVGDNRKTACVWDRLGPADDARWEASPLPQADPNLNSNVVAISPNGRYAAAVDALRPCLWTRNPDRTWTREAIGPEDSLYPRAVNDEGRVAGVRYNRGDGTTEAAVWARDKGVEVLPRPPLFASAEAAAINNRGEVVGIIDGPHGSPIGPNGFVWSGGRLQIIVQGGPYFSSATGINDHGQIIGVVQKEDEEEPKPGANPPDPARP